MLMGITFDGEKNKIEGGDRTAGRVDLLEEQPGKALLKMSFEPIPEELWQGDTGVSGGKTLQAEGSTSVKVPSVPSRLKTERGGGGTTVWDEAGALGANLGGTCRRLQRFWPSRELAGKPLKGLNHSKVWSRDLIYI